MHVPNIRCDATHNGQRCSKTQGHSGWHADGLVEWVDRTLAQTLPPCSTVNAHSTEYVCTEPQGHKGAHRAGGLIWTDPMRSAE